MLRPPLVGSRPLVGAGSNVPTPLQRRRGFRCGQRLMYCQCSVSSSSMNRNSFKPAPPTTTIPYTYRTLGTSRRRRRPKNINMTLPSSSTTTTTKDRMRRLIETNQLAAVPPVAQQLNDLLDVATGRLTWLRDTVFRTWNPDYKSSNSTSQQQQLQLEGSEKSLPKQEAKRPPWRPLVMDARWWFWNLVWALFPAAFIAFYCEFRGKPRMLAYQRQRELEELQQIVGKEAANEMMLKKLEDESEASFLDESFWERTSRIRQELTIWWRGGVDNNVDEEKEVPEATHMKEHTPVEVLSKNNEQKAEAPKPQPFPTKTFAVPEKTPQKKAEVTTSSTAPETPRDLQQQQHKLLLERIEQLEAIVQRQEEQRQKELERQLDRLRSSGIRNRAIQDRGGSSVIQTGYKAGIHDKDIAPEEQIQIKKETSPSLSRVAWDTLSKIAEKVQRTVVDEKEKETRNSTTSADDEKSVDKTANTPETTMNDNGQKESSTAAPIGLPKDRKEKAKPQKSDTSSDQHEDVENIEKRPWWKVW